MFLLLLFSRQVVSNSLQPHGLWHARLSCPLPSPRVCPSSCPLNKWCYPTVILFSSWHSIFPSIRVFSNESALCITWSKYWSFSFSISPSNEYSGLISFKIAWFDLLAVQDSQESSPAQQFKSNNSLALYLSVQGHEMHLPAWF